ncbi:histidine phosphatase family protein [Dyella jiangningensis]|uniref:histidine phosphatase family protein n=1 Tax=Dyella jiangningensis TaxID=1379159 RepID=UPI00240EF563|nr:histidine phosphatase family protein [Dyella jiangningensis]MDG2537790.1 histidine phosphatase family protein [Dyella jiangningensis]
MAKLLFCRHGETELNRLKRFQGRLDQPLNEAGRMQADALAAHIPRDVSRILSSPLLRAKQTADRLSHIAGRPVEIEHAFIERDFGFCEGLTWPEANAIHPHLTFASALESWDSAGDGVEPIRAVVRRVASAMSMLLDDHRDERIVVVTHGFVIVAVQWLASSLSEDDFFTHRMIDNAQWLEVTRPAPGGNLHRANVPLRAG